MFQHIYPQWSTEEQSSVIAERSHRARINSAIFVSSEGRGFDSIEFIRRYGSQSVLCRKAKSAENIPLGNHNVSIFLSIFSNDVMCHPTAPLFRESIAEQNLGE